MDLWNYKQNAQDILSLIASEPVRRNFENFHEITNKRAAAWRCNAQGEYTQLCAQSDAAFRELCSAFGDPDSDAVKRLIDNLDSEIRLCGFGATGESTREDRLDFHREIAIDRSVAPNRLHLRPELLDRLRR